MNRTARSITASRRFPNTASSRRSSFDGNIAGGSERIDTDKYDKEDARDFALWKLVGEDEEPGWDAPFGRGRPGWHIECSAMSMKYLGETFDLHAGGQDLQFPHHENEIAQSEGATGKLFAKYWIHSEFLKIDDVTMSKSKGNFFTFRDLREQGYSPLAIRYLLLSVPTRKQLNFTFEGLQGAESTVERLRNFRSLVSDAKTVEGSNPEVAAFVSKALDGFRSRDGRRLQHRRGPRRDPRPGPRDQHRCLPAKDCCRRIAKRYSMRSRSSIPCSVFSVRTNRVRSTPRSRRWCRSDKTLDVTATLLGRMRSETSLLRKELFWKIPRTGSGGSGGSISKK